MRNPLFGSVALVALAVGGARFAQAAAPVTLDASTLTVVGHAPLGSPATLSDAESITPGSAYSNATNFTGFGITGEGATATVPVTNLVGDDLTPISNNGLVTQFKFSVANFNAAATTARVRVFFYDSTGPSGGPGNAVAGLNFNPIAFANGVTVFNTGPLGANSFAIPAGQIWAGEFFDNVGAPATTPAQLNNLGLGTFDPPDVGSSQDRDYFSPNTNQPYTTSPLPGTIEVSPFGGNPVANYGFEIVPEPGTLTLLATGMLVLPLRRRSRRN